MGARLKKVRRDFVNLDASESVFFTRSLESIKTKTYDVRYPEFRARELIPVSFEASPGATTITFRTFDMVGMAKIIANYATDIPRVDLVGSETTSPIRSMADSYAYSLQDVRSAQLAGIPLDQRKANAAKRALMALEDSIALNGDADHGLIGLTTAPNVPDVAIAADGTGASSTWASKTAELILRDINAMVEAVIVPTKGMERPDTLMMDSVRYNRIATLKFTDNGETVLSFLLRTSPYIKKIEIWEKLATAGAGGTPMAILYNKDPDKLTLEVPQDFEQLPVQEVGLEYITNCHMRTGGVIVYYPLSMAKADGL